MTRRPRRGGRSAEWGLTLIELLVTIALMTVAFVGLLIGVSTVVRQTTSTGDDAQLTTVARQVATVIEASPAQGGMTYVTCSPSAGGGYTSQLPTLPTGYTVPTLTVAQAVGAQSSHSITGNPNAPLTALSACGGAGQSPTPDYGVQQIKFTVKSPGGNTITRTVYKRWN